MEKCSSLSVSFSEQNTDHEVPDNIAHNSHVLMIPNNMSEQDCKGERELKCSHEKIIQESHLHKSGTSENKGQNTNVATTSSVNATSDYFSLKYYDEIKNYLLSRNFPDTKYKIFLKKRAKRYCIKDGELHYGSKIVLKTKTEQLELMKETHIEEKTGIHLGVKKMSHIISSKCFWRGQYRDIANFVRQCSKCTELAESSCAGNNSKIDFLNEDSDLDCTKIWQKVEVYLHGPFTNENGETVYISAVIDTVSHYVVVKCLLENNVSSFLARFLLEVFCVFGIVKCFLSKTCKHYLEQVKEAFKAKTNVFQNMNITLDSSLEDLVYILPGGEEKCSWILSSLETFTSNFVHFNETDLYIFILKLNIKMNQSSPFMKMFNRFQFSSSEEDKENANDNLGYTKKGNTCRRILRSSVLQCRHCQEVFTSKISFRIHQRTHIDEAQKRGLLDGQAKYMGERERKILRRPLMRQKYRALRSRSSFSSENSLQASVTDCRSSTLQVPEKHCPELRANIIEAVMQHLASSRHKRKRRGKYKKFPLEIQDQMAQYAIEKGNLMAVQHFSDKLGVIVSESTIRNIVKCYQNFTPDVRRDIGKYASLYGMEAAATHYSEKLGRELKLGLIRKFKNQYLSQNSKANMLNNKVESNKVAGVNGIESVQSKVVASYSSDMRDRIGQYACDHTVSGTIDFFYKKFNLSLTEHVVRRFKKEYQCKRKINEHQLNLSEGGNEHQLAHRQQQEQEHLQLQLQERQRSLEEQQQQTLPQLIPLPVEEQQLQSQEHLLIHPQLTLFNNTLQGGQQPNLGLLGKHQDVPCNPHHSEGLHQNSLSVGMGVTLLPLHHQTNANSSSLQEGSIQSSSQTIDILQSSLNLLNNPQMNNPTTIIYNPSYQLGSTSNIPSNQIIPINQQQNPQITFQAANQCTDTNTQPTVPLTYRSQEVPISASVILNQNVSAIQSFPNSQVYPAFSQLPSVQSNVLTVGEHSMPLSQPASHVSSLSEDRQSLSSSAVPTTITVAVTPVSEQHFQHHANSPGVVLSQPVSQPILISHTQTLLQHIIDSQAHLNPCPTPVAQHLIGEINTRQPTSQTYPSVIEQESHSQLFSQKLSCCLPQDQFEASSMFGGRESMSIELSGSNAKNMKSAVESDSLPNLNGVESHSVVPVTELLQTSLEANGKEVCAPSGSVEVLESSSASNSSAIGPMCPPAEDSRNVDDQRQPSSEKTRRKKQTKRLGRKKGSKGEVKCVEQKRGTYATYSPEIRAEMGKYAAEYGSQKACDFFQSTRGFKVAESTMRGLRDKYLRKRAMCSEDGNEVTSLGYAPRGRPMRLGRYDEVVQDCIKDLVKSGEKITSFLAIVTAKHVLMQYEPCLLEENGGKIRLNVTWAKSFLKRIGINK